MSSNDCVISHGKFQISFASINPIMECSIYVNIKVYVIDNPRGIRSLSRWSCFNERAAHIIEVLARESEMPKSKGRRSADDDTI